MEAKDHTGRPLERWQADYLIKTRATFVRKAREVWFAVFEPSYFSINAKWPVEYYIIRSVGLVSLIVFNKGLYDDDVMRQFARWMYMATFGKYFYSQPKLGHYQILIVCLGFSYLFLN